MHTVLKTIRCHVQIHRILLAALCIFPSQLLHAQREFSEVEIATLPVAEDIYMLTGQGGNIGVSIGDDGTFLIDDQFAPLVDKIKTAIAALDDRPVKFVVNTHWHGDHTGGNAPFGRDGAVIVAHDNVRMRLKSAQPATPEAALPVLTFGDGVTFHWNGHTIEVKHVGPAHTDGDSVVFFREANVVHMGDIYFNGIYPFIDAASGGRIRGMIENVSDAIAMITPDTKVIPGHGPLSNRDEMVAFRDMLQLSADRIDDLKAKGESLEEIIAAKPTRDLDEQWGGGFLSPDRWVEIVYSTL